MSRPLGDELPEALLTLLDGHDLASRLGHAILITTIDARGWPHPALLSYGEVVAVDARRLRVATYRSSGTSDNLRRTGHLTLCLVEAGMAYYLKTRALEQSSPAGFPALARFEAIVDHVLVDQAREDVEPDARITSGVRFEGRSAPELLAQWTAVVNALRA